MTDEIFSIVVIPSFAHAQKSWTIADSCQMSCRMQTLIQNHIFVYLKYDFAETLYWHKHTKMYTCVCVFA